MIPATKFRRIIISTIWMIVLTACQSASPLPDIIVTSDTEFTLAPDQIALIADLTVRLIGVADDERCPREIECAASGPVSISLSVHRSDTEPTDINLQTFTGNDGRSPDFQFEGIQDRVVYEGYLIRVVGVLPYPVNLTEMIRDSEYRVALMVSKE